MRAAAGGAAEALSAIADSCSGATCTCYVASTCSCDFNDHAFTCAVGNGHTIDSAGIPCLASFAWGKALACCLRALLACAQRIKVFFTRASHSR